MLTAEKNMLVQWLLIVIAIAVFVKWLWSRRALYLLSWKINGQISYPIVGNILSFLKHEGMNDIPAKRITQAYILI